MSSTIFGTTAGGIPGPTFKARRDETGKWTASLTIAVKRGDYESLSGSYRKGTSISAVYPQVQSYFGGMVVTDHEYIEKPGGLDEVVVNFVGAFMDESGDPDERDYVYDYQVDLAEKPIIEHPKFAQVYPPNQELLIKYYEGKVRVVDVETNPNKFVDNYSGQILRDYEPYSGEFGTEFYDIIVTKGIRTYLQPMAEYTETVTDSEDLTGKIDLMGKIDAPPENPPQFDGFIWFMSGATQSKSSDNPITWSRTWTSIEDNEQNNFLYGTEEV